MIVSAAESSIYGKCDESGFPADVRAAMLRRLSVACAVGAAEKGRRRAQVSLFLSSGADLRAVFFFRYSRIKNVAAAPSIKDSTATAT